VKSTPYQRPTHETVSPYSRPLHVLAWLTLLATFPLIFVGGQVTSYDAGLAVPDWPNSFGHNMFLLPWEQWKQGGVFLEHTHRLLGTVVGALSIALVAWAWLRKDSTRTQRWLSVAILGAVLVQGILGGLRVIWINLDLAVVHGCFAQATMCLIGLMVVASSGWWRRAADQARPDQAKPLRRLVVAGVVLLFVQLILGAMVRHYQADLAIPDLPLAYGKWIPPVSQEGLEQANWSRLAEPALGTTTLWQIWLHFGHRIGAVVVSAVLIAVSVLAWKRRDEARGLAVPAVAIATLLVTQVTLGVLTVLFRVPPDLATFHVAVGALLLLTTFVLAVRVMRLYAPRRLNPGLERGDGAPAPLSAPLAPMNG